MGFQGMEYYQAPSTISDSIYGSTFYLATGQFEEIGRSLEQLCVLVDLLGKC